jgi:hypothetical protein
VRIDEDPPDRYGVHRIGAIVLSCRPDRSFAAAIETLSAAEPLMPLLNNY